MIVYRICERKNGKLYTLFHAFDGSREMEMGKWLKAQIKHVKDGSRKKDKRYKSGFHVLEDIEEVRRFAKRFTAKRDLVIVKCEIGKKYWEKKHSHANVLLADRIKLLEIVEDIEIK